MIVSLETPFKCPSMQDFLRQGQQGIPDDIPNLREEVEGEDYIPSTDSNSFLHYNSPLESTQYEMSTTNMEAV